MPDIPEGQRWLVSRMMKLGHLSNRDPDRGICFATSIMAIQAMMLGEDELKKYNERLQQIADLPLLLFNIMKQNPFQDPILGAPIHKEFQDIVAYFDAIELLQNEKLKERAIGIFPEKDAIRTRNLKEYTHAYTNSVEMDAHGGLDVTHVFFGEYTKESLATMFEQFQKIAEEKKLDCPVCFTLESTKHSITCSWQPGHGDTPGKWYFFDANRCPIKKMNNTSELADNILSSVDFEEGKIHTRIVCTGNTKEAISKISDQWFQSDQWRAPHEAMTTEQFLECDRIFSNENRYDADKQPDFIVQKRKETNFLKVSENISLKEDKTHSDPPIKTNIKNLYTLFGQSIPAPATKTSSIDENDNNKQNSVNKIK